MGLIDKIFGSKDKNKYPNPDQGLRLVEGISGVWFYHLAHGEKNQALCDDTRTVMSCPAPVDTWGYRSHLNERYCQECERIAVEQNLGLPAIVVRTPEGQLEGS